MSARCYFASDLHGRIDRYEALFARLDDEPPEALFLGGDLLPNPLLPPESRLPVDPRREDFIHGYLGTRLERLRERLQDRFPEIFVILGNDDARFEEASVLDLAGRGLWKYAHGRRFVFRQQYLVFGYAFVPPSPFRMKDWERYDVSRYVDPGCVSPEEGLLTVPRRDRDRRLGTIRDDLEALVKGVVRSPADVIIEWTGTSSGRVVRPDHAGDYPASDAAAWKADGVGPALRPSPAGEVADTSANTSPPTPPEPGDGGGGVRGEVLLGDGELRRAIFLFHAPPYQTNLDRAALDGKAIDQVPLDVHIGSMAIRKFIQRRQPLLTMHGHVHESARLTGSWKDRIGDTWCFGAAHDGAELALVRFDLDDLAAADRILLG